MTESRSAITEKKQPDSIPSPVKPDNEHQSSVNNKKQVTNKDQKKELQKQQKIFQQLEEKIAKLKLQKQQLEAALADHATYSDKNKFIQTETDYKRVSDELVNFNFEYEKVFEKIMKLESTR
jgi:ATP-binding cassette subfamily F protein 3